MLQALSALRRCTQKQSHRQKIACAQRLSCRGHAFASARRIPELASSGMGGRMNESQTRLLIQRELDGNLTQEEETRLRRVLMVNDSAVSFRANLSQVVAVVHELELPDSVRPGDSSKLAVEILDSLPVAKANFWDPLLDIFGKCKGLTNDPRSTRSVGSSSSIQLRRVSPQQSTNSSSAGKGTGVDSSQRNKSLHSGESQSLIDPAVLAPKREHSRDHDKDKTPNGLQAVDQYVTGTHSAIGGLGKRLNMQKSQPVEEVGKTLADAIRERVHEHLREEAEYSDHPDNETVIDPGVSAEATAPVMELQSQLTEDLRTDFVKDRESYSPPISVLPAVLPISANAPNIVPANITTQQVTSSVNLGGSMVLTVSQQGVKPSAPSDNKASQQLTPKTFLNGHNFSNEELTEWKSGTYPVVPPPAKQNVDGQAETGPLVPFAVNNAPNFSKLNLKNTAEIMKQLAAEAQKEKTEFPQWAPPGDFQSNGPAAQPAPWAFAPETSAPVLEPWPQPVSSTPQHFSAPWAPPSVQQQTEPLPAQPPVSAPSPAPAAAPTPVPISFNPNPVEQNELEIPAPKIVPVIRNNGLPIEAIGDRINQLFNEPVEPKPPTVVEQPAIQIEAPRQNSFMEKDVNECLASLGRLADIKYSTNNPGKIKELGRFLLTDETIERIDSVIKKGANHSHARVITMDAAQQMANALEPLLRVQGVVGYMLCGYDGLPIASELPNDVDIELLGGCTLVSYMNSHHIIKVMGHSRIKQIIMQMPVGCMLLADFGKGVLVTLSNENDPAILAQLSQIVESITGG